MRVVLGIIIGAPLGGLAGYIVWVWLACVIFDLGNLCGLPGVFITGPLGAIAGAVLGSYLLRQRPPR